MKVNDKMKKTEERRFFVIGNWKMNSNFQQIKNSLSFLDSGELDPDTEVVVAPSAPYLHFVKENLKALNVEIALQNCHTHTAGSFTGEVSAKMAVDVGCRWVILGHPERRTKFSEGNQLIGEKIKHVITTTDLKIIACLCEQTVDRTSNQTMKILGEQLRSIVDNLGGEDWSRVVIAYEALWTLDDGKPATPEQAQDTVQNIRQWLSENVNEQVGKSTRILYAGFVSGSNCVEFCKQPDIDGFLVGGASLKPEFVDIVNSHSISKVQSAA